MQLTLSWLILFGAVVVRNRLLKSLSNFRWTTNSSASPPHQQREAFGDHPSKGQTHQTPLPFRGATHESATKLQREDAPGDPERKDMFHRFRSPWRVPRVPTLAWLTWRRGIQSL